MKSTHFLSNHRAQTAIEYMVLLAVTVGIVLVAFKTDLVRVYESANVVFTKDGRAISGDWIPECGDNVCYTPVENPWSCPLDCDPMDNNVACRERIITPESGPSYPINECPLCPDGRCETSNGETAENCPWDCEQCGTCATDICCNDCEMTWCVNMCVGDISECTNEECCTGCGWHWWTTNECRLDPEPFYFWRSGAWSSCNSSCQEVNTYRCWENLSGVDTQIVADSYCAGSRPTPSRACCTYQWRNRGWESCQSNCRQRRIYECWRRAGTSGSWLGRVANSNCSGSGPSTSRECCEFVTWWDSCGSGGPCYEDRVVGCRDKFNFSTLNLDTCRDNLSWPSGPGRRCCCSGPHIDGQCGNCNDCCTSGTSANGRWVGSTRWWDCNPIGCGSWMGCSR